MQLLIGGANGPLPLISLAVLDVRPRICTVTGFQRWRELFGIHKEPCLFFAYD
jgi:hypothetical protein